MVLPSLNSPKDLNLVNEEGVSRNDIFQVLFRECKDTFAGQNQLRIGVSTIEAGSIQERSVVHLRVKEEL